jgi:hypothetical protein
MTREEHHGQKKEDSLLAYQPAAAVDVGPRPVSFTSDLEGLRFLEG